MNHCNYLLSLSNANSIQLMLLDVGGNGTKREGWLWLNARLSTIIVVIVLNICNWLMWNIGFHRGSSFFSSFDCKFNSENKLICYAMIRDPSIPYRVFRRTLFSNMYYLKIILHIPLIIGAFALLGGACKVTGFQNAIGIKKLKLKWWSMRHT